MTKRLKQDMNFLEYPLWFQDCRLAATKESHVWKYRDGFIFRSGYSPPAALDYMFLCFLMLKSQQAGWKERIEVSRYEVLKGCGITPSKLTYRRFEESLTRWKMVGIEFKGLFYDGVEYQVMQFGVLDDWHILEHKNRQVEVDFNRHWLQCIRHSTFFRFIDFADVNRLHHSPLALRLYELLIKAFQGRDTWEIDAVKLAEKIPMAQRFPSGIIRRIKTALVRVSKDTSLAVSMTVRRPARGKAVIVFRHSKRKKGSDAPSGVLVPRELICLIPRKHWTEKVRKLVSMWLAEKGMDYVKRNIVYTNIHSSKEHGYCGFLARALKGDWGGDISPDALKEADMKQRQTESVEPGSYVWYKGSRLRVHEAGEIYLPDGTCIPPGMVMAKLMGGEMKRASGPKEADRKAARS